MVALALAPLAASAQTPAEIQAALDAAYAKYKDLKEGANADYIPALAEVDSRVFGIALVTPDGKLYTVGDIDTQVSIQSISKVFTMAKVIEQSGHGINIRQYGCRRHRAGVRLHRGHRAVQGPEMNAMVNPGAITATSMVEGAPTTRSGA